MGKREYAACLIMHGAGVFHYKSGFHPRIRQVNWPGKNPDENSQALVFQEKVPEGYSSGQRGQTVNLLAMPT
jgi:hypothetical protein